VTADHTLCQSTFKLENTYSTCEAYSDVTYSCHTSMFEPTSKRVLLLFSLPYIFFGLSLLWSKFAPSNLGQDELSKSEEEFRRSSPYTGTGRPSGHFTSSSFYSFSLWDNNSNSNDTKGISLYLLFLEFKSIIILLFLALLYCNFDLGTIPGQTQHVHQSGDLDGYAEEHYLQEDYGDPQDLLLQRYRETIGRISFGNVNTNTRYPNTTAPAPSSASSHSNNYTEFLAQQERIRAALGMSE